MRNEEEVRKELNRLCKKWNKESVKGWTAERLDRLNRINERIIMLEYVLEDNDFLEYDYV